MLSCGFFFLSLFALLPSSLLLAKCEPPKCLEIYEYSLVAAYTFEDHAAIYIHECSTEAKIRFYRIEFFDFSPNESIKISPIETVTNSSLTIETSKCGDASVTIFPVQQARHFINMDFSFSRHDDNITLVVSKYKEGQFASTSAETPANSNERVTVLNPPKS